MNTLKPLQDTSTIRAYLAIFDRSTAKRGAHYFKYGAVLELECIEPGAKYAAVVRGSMDYEVVLTFDDGDWSGECSCPVTYECKHIYSAILAFQNQAARFPGTQFPLRRTKNQVAKDLPDRIEEDLLCELEAEQNLPRRVQTRATTPAHGADQTGVDESRFNFLTSLLRLCQICCHPALVDGALRRAESAKVNALTDLLEPLMDEGHKVLVFTED